MYFNIIAACFLLINFSFHSFAIENSENHFTIQLSLVDDPEAIISAKLNIIDGRLITGSGGSYDWKRGWGDFVEVTSAISINGEVLDVTEEGEGFDSYWQLSINGNPYHGRATLEYQVDLSYARQEWDFGNEQAGRIRDGAIYSVTKPFFLTSDPDAPATISFDIPKTWNIASPWPSIETNVFTAENFSSLSGNSFVLGEFESSKISSNGFDLEIVMLGDFDKPYGLISDVMKKILPSYLTLFPGTPDSIYLMTFLQGPNEDAEAFDNGAAFTTTLNLSEENNVFWSEFMAHELFHFWNGRRIRANPRSDSQWFTEGVTDYYAHMLLLNHGIINEDWFIRRTENILGNYIWFFNTSVYDGLSLVEAGKEKGRNRFGVYDGGWAIAFALDHEIRTRSSGKKSLDDVMLTLFKKYGLTGDRYTLQELFTTINKSTDLDLSSFFEKYIQSHNPVPISDYMAAYGFDVFSNEYANEFYLMSNKSASSEQKSRWQHLTNDRFR